MDKPEKKIKVIAALSGGVDSAVAAALLKKQGYNVVAVHFLFFKTTGKLSFPVKKIAKKLGIPLKIVDARKKFKKRVIDYFVGAYQAGLTPNPCVVCNKEVKFRLMFDLMKKYRADAVATGHYAQIKPNAKNIRADDKNNPVIQITGQNKKQLKIADYKLYQAKDKTKDQSYFLYKLTQKDLAKIIFPLGELKKTEVKKMAKKMKLPSAENESQDICFLACNGLNTYLNKYLEPSRGNIIDASENVAGLHRGLPFYTIGQRKGIEIGGTGPYWVVGKNVRKNELIVTNDPKKLLTKKFWFGKMNWIKKDIKFPLRAKVQIRYRADKFSAIIKKKEDGKWEVRSGKNLRAVTPGQSAVFYKNSEVLGGGTIKM